jgi:hypothetical protein
MKDTLTSSILHCCGSQHSIQLTSDNAPPYDKPAALDTVVALAFNETKGEKRPSLYSAPNQLIP